MQKMRFQSSTAALLVHAFTTPLTLRHHAWFGLKWRSKSTAQLRAAAKSGIQETSMSPRG